MRRVNARIPVGRTVLEQAVYLYSQEEAKEFLKDKEWYFGQDIYSADQPNMRIGWLAEFGNSDGIYVEAKSYS